MARNSNGMAILRKAASQMPPGSPWRDRINAVVQSGAQVGIHLGVFVEPFLEAILDGRKTIESRFGVHRSPPFDRVQAGDLILLKRSGGPIVGIALAGEATYYHLDTDTLEDIRERFAAQIYAEDDAFWTARSQKRFASLIEIEEVTKIETLSIEKRDRRGWVTYAEGDTACLTIAN